MDVRDQDVAELLRALLEELRAQREETVALLAPVHDWLIRELEPRTEAPLLTQPGQRPGPQQRVCGRL